MYIYDFYQEVISLLIHEVLNLIYCLLKYANGTFNVIKNHEFNNI